MYALKLDSLMLIRNAGRYTQTNGWKHNGQIINQHILLSIEEGNCIFKFEDRIVHLAQNECILIPANTFYAPHANGTCVFKAFHFIALTEKLTDVKRVQTPLFSSEIPFLTIPEKFKSDNTIELYLEKALTARSMRTPEAYIKRNIHFINALVHISEKATQTGISTLAQEIKTYIDTHLEDELSIIDISKHFGYSKQHTVRIFKESFRQTPSKYILKMRLERSLDFLSESRLSVNEIAQQCGFKDLNYFSRQFKKSYGISPTAYRKKLRERV